MSDNIYLNIKKIYLNGKNTNVNFYKSNGEGVKIEYIGNFNHTIKQERDILRIRVFDETLDKNDSEIFLYLPNKIFSEFLIENSCGSIDIEGVNVENLSINNFQSSINLSNNYFRSVDIRSSSGDISFTNNAISDLSIQTNDSNIYFQIFGKNDLKMNIVNGEGSVKGFLNNFKQNHCLRATSGLGDVYVELSENGVFTTYGEISSGNGNISILSLNELQ